MNSGGNEDGDESSRAGAGEIRRRLRACGGASLLPFGSRAWPEEREIPSRFRSGQALRCACEAAPLRTTTVFLRAANCAHAQQCGGKTGEGPLPGTSSFSCCCLLAIGSMTFVTLSGCYSPLTIAKG